MSDLPPGFVLDKPAAAASAPQGLPPGFVVDKPQQGIGEQLWEGIKNFTSGVAGGVAGKGVPAGTASQFEGGRAGFGGRMVGAGAAGVAEGLWEAIKTPGQYATGERQPGPQSAAEGLGTALLMAGQGGRRPIVASETAPRAAGAIPAEAQTAAQGMRQLPAPDIMRGPQGQDSFVMARGGGGQAPIPERPQGPLALPPPTTQLPGRPWTPTGVGPAEFSRLGTEMLQRGGPMQAALERLPGPGLIPPGPGATMRPSAPSMPPRAAPPPLAAERMMPPVQPRDVPPRLPPPAKPAEATAAEVPLSEATTSPMANAIAMNDGGAIDRALVRGYRTAVQPGKPARRSFSGLEEQDRRIMTAVDTIIANRGTIRVSTPDGRLIPLPNTPSLRQFSEAIGENKKQIFKAYDEKKRLAGERGVEVDLAPVVQRLREVAARPDVADLHPPIANEATRVADQWERTRVFTPSEAQDMIESLNQSVGQGVMTDSITSHRGVANAVRGELLSQLDKAIDGANIPGYQATRNQYRALRSIEQDVANAAAREANKRAGGTLANVTNLLAGEELLRGAVTLNPKAVVTAGALKGAQMAIRYINEPNRAIGRMFAHRIDKPLRQSYGRGAGLGSAAGAAALEDDRGPMGGTIVGQRSVQRPTGYPSPPR